MCVKGRVRSHENNVLKGHVECFARQNITLWNLDLRIGPEESGCILNVIFIVILRVDRIRI